MFGISSENFLKREEEILDFWKKGRIFEQSLKNRENAPLFVFYDGPPFATGLPHYGHLLAGTIKDVILRYQTMRGYYVPRRFGWDCHGLPIENEIEKQEGLSGATSIEEFGVANFNEACRKIVLRYTQEWEHTVERMGRWVDFKGAYRTMDKDFMESVWWVFSELVRKGLVYEGYKVMPFSAKLGTPLSNFEANLNYKEVDDPSLTLLFSLKEEADTFFLVWTTTPWTLPSNLALTVGPTIEYVKLLHISSGKKYILAASRLMQYFPSSEEYQIVHRMKGEELVGFCYEPLFPYFADRALKGAFRVVMDGSVSLEEGTGIVHTAPAFGEVDALICAREGIEMVCPVDQNGHFTEEVAAYAGMFVKDADKEIIRHLKKTGHVFHHGQIRHRYPFCWRSDTPLIYKAVNTWFIAVEKIKDRLLKANCEIYWVPSHIKEGRFGKWLENARDWAVSRNRYWGTPIPIWRSPSGKWKVLGSIQELQELSGQKVEDLHRHYIDELSFVEEGEIYRRIPEVFDCWFESGSMPYAQNHYPFTGENALEFPADFIAEGLDQTRGWFYTLTVLSCALWEKPPFKNVIVNGIILAEDGAKMSKRLKNYPEPETVIERYGADAVRLYLLSSPAVQAEDLKFSERGVELGLRQALIPLWNAYVFLATYAQIYAWQPKELCEVKPAAAIDRWILSLLQKLIQEVTEALDHYLLMRAVEPTIDFIEKLTNWYIRRSRARFWSEKASSDREEAFATLYTVIKSLVKITAPFIPFISEAIYRGLCQEKEPISVHLCDYPLYQPFLRDEALEQEMSYVQLTVGIGHALRKEHKLKVRQPLAKAHIITADRTILEALKRQQHLIQEELNVKETTFSDKGSAFVFLTAKPNFRILGKKVGKMMPTLQSALEKLAQEELEAFLQKKELVLTLEEESYLLTAEDLAIERKVVEGIAASTEQGVTVALDTALTEELLQEGMARELINKINTMRRDNGYAVTDRIEVFFKTTERVRACFTLYQEYICHEVLAVRVEWEELWEKGPLKEEGSATLGDLNGEPTQITLRRV